MITINEIKTHMIEKFYDLIVKIFNDEFKTYLNMKINECFTKTEIKKILKQGSKLFKKFIWKITRKFK